MKLNSLILILLSFIVIPFPISAAGIQETITWDDCVREARKNNPDLLAAGTKVEQAAAEKGQTVANLLPQIGASAATSNSKSSGEDRGNSYSYGIEGRQLIFDGLKSWYELDQSSQNLIAIRQEYEITSMGVRRDLRYAFIALLKAQDLVDLSEGIALRRKQQAGLVELRYQGGREHKGALLTARANLAQAEFDITKARREIKVSREQLHKELGREVFVPMRAEGVLGIESGSGLDPDFGILVEEHPSVIELAARKEESRLELKSSYSEFSPEIYGSAGLRRSDSDWPPDDENWSLTLSVSLPIFEGGSRIEELSRTRAALTGAEEEERSGMSGVLLDLQETWINLRDADDNVSIQLQFLDAGEERARIANAQYSTGLISFDSWIIIEDDLVKVQKRYLEAQAEAMTAEAQWIYARGGTLKE
jgi:outer membrane protein